MNILLHEGARRSSHIFYVFFHGYGVHYHKQSNGPVKKKNVQRITYWCGILCSIFVLKLIYCYSNPTLIKLAIIMKAIIKGGLKKMLFVKPPIN